ncbi:Small acid-soluble spore protein (gamma-type SASP) [Fictibacillus macauensis ZFHKF-1]|uniref:Small, acid-soluble spore protein gamma-type n=1 Tax=Fictibacillus macauensis ZFHKF-1 TaxID=1196324 RepID=I8UCL0_9BACL|nr:gamma-type small acid-soluble spore protein [Fictibacillus macauensis]EIT84665.1 Small acid-soluble spore protein (gamma-type SASP) [Fictibacillus macauensis ZFHKF-1]
MDKKANKKNAQNAMQQNQQSQAGQYGAEFASETDAQNMRQKNAGAKARKGQQQ